MKAFRKIRVYVRSFDFGVRTYQFCKLLPKGEMFGISSQLRRAVLSISTNIAEGSKAISQFDHANFLNISEKSTAEAQHLYQFCQALGYAPGAPYEQLLEELGWIARMLHAYRVKVYAEAVRQEKMSRNRQNASTLQRSNVSTNSIPTPSALPPAATA